MFPFVALFIVLYSLFVKGLIGNAGCNTISFGKSNPLDPTYSFLFHNATKIQCFKFDYLSFKALEILFGSSYLVHYLHPTVTKTLSQLTKQSWLLLIWICVTVFNNWKLSMVDSKQMITVWLSVNFIFFSWRELKVICRKLCLDEHSKIQISYMLLFEIGDLEEKSRGFLTQVILLLC